MSRVESLQPSMEEESFIILGSTPTPSMENFTLTPASLQPYTSIGERENNESVNVLPVEKMETSTQLDSTTYSLLPNSTAILTASGAQLQCMQSLSESSKALLVASAESNASSQPASYVAVKQPSILEAYGDKENATTNSLRMAGQPTASFIIGETQSILHQFPSLSQSSMSIEEVNMLQKLSLEHSQLKNSLKRANLAMRKNFISIQQLRDESKTRYIELEVQTDKLREQLEQMTEEQDKLMIVNMQLVDSNSTLHAELNEAKQAIVVAKDELEHYRQIAQTEKEELERIREVERQSAQLEVDELRKESSERQSIIQNLAKKIENLELQMKGFVVVNTNKPEANDGAANFIALDVHKQQIKKLERQMSVEVAKNLEFEDIRKLYLDEIECLKTNAAASERMFAQSRIDAQKLYDDIKERDDIIKELRKQVGVFQEKADVLAAQSEIFQKDFEAERVGRQELASEKSRILGEFEVLQRQNAELAAKISMTETEREQIAHMAAQKVQEATSSQESSSSVQATEDKKKNLLRCPLCLKGYKELATLQSHAAFCMGNE